MGLVVVCLAGRLANPELRRMVGGLVSHLCYDLHGCQSQWQRDKFLAELKMFPLFNVHFISLYSVS